MRKWGLDHDIKGQISISTSPFSIFMGYTATFALASCTPVCGSHSHPCHGQTTLPLRMAPSPSGPPRCRQMLSIAEYVPSTLATQISLSPQRNSLAWFVAGSSDTVVSFTKLIMILDYLKKAADIAVRTRNMTCPIGTPVAIGLFFRMDRIARRRF